MTIPLDMIPDPLSPPSDAELAQAYDQGYQDGMRAANSMRAEKSHVDLNEPVLRCPRCGSYAVELRIPKGFLEGRTA